MVGAGGRISEYISDFSSSTHNALAYGFTFLAAQPRKGSFLNIETADPPQGGFTYAQENKNGATDYYEMQGGPVKEKFVGGTVSWRNNNPGNIVYAHQSTAIGSYYDAPAAHTFAIFPDYQTGVLAAVTNLQGPLYSGAGLSINAGMKRWTGARGEKLRNYDNTVDAALGLPGTTLISSLSFGQLQIMVTQGIQVAEGWKSGKVVIPKQKSNASATANIDSIDGGSAGRLDTFVHAISSLPASAALNEAAHDREHFTGRFTPVGMAAPHLAAIA